MIEVNGDFVFYVLGLLLSQLGTLGWWSIDALSDPSLKVF